jgi:glycerol uptake facilitator-like aquaporin
MPSLRALVCEFLGTAFLLATVVGSGILGSKLASGNVALAVLAVAFATGAVLTALILAFGGISSHFNPIVTLSAAVRKELRWGAVMPYILAQVAGASAGVIVANLMFELPAIVLSQTARTGSGQWLGEFVATLGLLGVIFGAGKFKPSLAPFAVGFYVAGAIWFTSSTCFANPAVTVARVLTDTLTGIRLVDVPAYIVAQLAAGAAGLLLFGWLFADERQTESSTKDRANQDQDLSFSVVKDGLPEGQEAPEMLAIR